MGLDIGIGDGASPIPIEGGPQVCLENDGYYWYLHPLFERLAQETGQYIDLYGDAVFAGEQLAALERILTEAQHQILSEPSEWSVHIGFELAPPHRESRREVYREEMLRLLALWMQVISQAKSSGHSVVCIGD
jgi:hypothetical protein